MSHLTLSSPICDKNPDLVVNGLRRRVRRVPDQPRQVGPHDWGRGWRRQKVSCLRRYLLRVLLVIQNRRLMGYSSLVYLLHRRLRLNLGCLWLLVNSWLDHRHLKVHLRLCRRSRHGRLRHYLGWRGAVCMCSRGPCLLRPWYIPAIGRVGRRYAGYEL